MNMAFKLYSVGPLKFGITFLKIFKGHSVEGLVITKGLCKCLLNCFNHVNTDMECSQQAFF